MGEKNGRVGWWARVAGVGWIVAVGGIGGLGGRGGLVGRSRGWTL